MTSVPAFGLNRFDSSSPSAFADDVKRAEGLGWDDAFIPSSLLRRQDPYVHLAFAAPASHPSPTAIAAPPARRGYLLVRPGSTG